MRLQGSLLHLSATDLSGHLGCRHLTQLERRRAEGRIESPRWRDPAAEILQERGLAHELAYLGHLAEHRGLDLVEMRDADLSEDGTALVCEAMAAGAGAIVQAPLVGGRWRGRADVLLRVDGTPSDLGDWSYVVADTKLAVETRGGTVLQLCLYSELVGELQGLLPNEMLVVAPGRYADPERLRTRDFFAYYEVVKGDLEATIGADDGASPPSTYPEPVPQCDICRWWSSCDRRRREDDHLCLVAGATRSQRVELVERDVTTLTALAGMQVPLDPRPRRGSPEGYEKVHHQARIQLASRDADRPLVEPLEGVGAGFGLSRLPEPSAGDVFLDLEGDAFVEGGGLEYLFGWVTHSVDGSPEYSAHWALSRNAEKAAFERLVDTLTERWKEDPDFHVYHFAPYEPAALKRLMGRHATREEELDRLLRAERFIDLYAVVREGLRVGVEGYGLKQLEPVHGFERETPLREASAWLHAVERALELGEIGAIGDKERTAVESYNRDDCVSTLRLRNWLEAYRAERVEGGIEIRRPVLGEGDPSEALDERTQRIRALAARLTEGISPDRAERNEGEQGRWLLAHLLEWHRREDKASWWEYFRLADLFPGDLLYEKRGLAGLVFVDRIGGTAACPIDRYRFPAQDHDVRAGQTFCVDTETDVGKIEAVDLRGRTIDVKKKKVTADLHPQQGFTHEQVRPRPLPEALERLAEWVAENGIDAPGDYRAARDLLLARAPRLVGNSGGPLMDEGEASHEAGRRLALALECGVLPVQGPPGTGKTYIGARMICALVREGKTVGITAGSHKVIRNLLDEVVEAAADEDVDLKCIQKVKDKSDDPPVEIEETKDNARFDRALAHGEAQVGAGTVWAWARDDAIASVDVLVIDEAGQMSLANALAAGQAASSIILLGDPQQLEQPMQGSHPEGCDVAALDHLLGDHDTMPLDRGLFFPETWRLHPMLAAFTSELFYEGRLTSHPDCERQAIVGPMNLAGAGLWLCPVAHAGNQTSSQEEVDRIAALVQELTAEEVSWIGMNGEAHPLELDEILIVSPYNAQVALLRAGLPHEARVGTVDKFQGQGAPVVIYSMATSDAGEAPRGMEFLFSLNRLNVATSRARCAVVIVASPRLLEPDCRTPHQMRLANALCRFRQLAGSL